MTIDELKSIAIVGAGTMGQGIAQVCASAGYNVLLYDLQPQLISSAVLSIEKSLTLAVEKGKLTRDQLTSTLRSIRPVTNFAQLRADLVIEAVVEKIDVKQKLFAELENINGESCILCTNTSSIPITQLAAGVQSPGRVAGLHFFNPAPLMKLVEIIQGAATKPDTIQLLVEFSRKLNKFPVVAQDSPGFIVNRVARHYYTESLKLLEENVADIKTIDSLLRSVGFKMGPFELMDLIGVDVNFSVTSSLYNSFHQEPRFRPSRVQQQKVDAGHLGRKTGKGFYDYPKG